MRHLKADIVYRATNNLREGESQIAPLQTLRALPSGVLVATGVGTSLKSYDRGLTWQRFGDSSLAGEDISDIAEGNGCAIVLTRGQCRTRVWKGDLRENQWVHTSDLPDATHGYVSVSSVGILIAALQGGNRLQVFVSSDNGVNWKLNYESVTSGTLNQFVMNASGIGIGMFLNLTEIQDESDFESTLLAVDCLAPRALDRRVVHANIQSGLSDGQHKWILGASGGIVFGYDSATGTLETRMAFDNEQLNITGVHFNQGKMCAIAEEPEPPGNIWVLYENSQRQWGSIRTGIRSYVYGSQLARDYLLILTSTTIYRLLISDLFARRAS